MQGFKKLFEKHDLSTFLLKWKYKKGAGFTLIELLIVLIIIGILVTLAIPQYELFAIKTRGAEAKQMLGAFADSLWRYYIESGDFPRSLGPPYYPPPIHCDTRIPGGTKYFRYQYLNTIASGFHVIMLFATDDDASENGPNGAVVSYRLYYICDPPSTPPGELTKKMDDHWYKYCLHYVKQGAGVAMRSDWP